MVSLKLTYTQISQLAQHFKGLESSKELNFSKRRKLIVLNEHLLKEAQALQEELNQLANEYCEKDEDGKLVVLENGGNRIKTEFMEILNTKLTELYNTETEIHYLPFKLDEKFFDGINCSNDTVKIIEQNFLEEVEE